MDIELLATTAVKECIAGTDFLSPWINDGDKEPSWDGAIYAYSNKSRQKKYLEGRAPVQVKGKQMARLKKSSITYPVSMVDLENFRNDGGVLFFVVGITEDRQKKIYYSALLPFMLNRLLDQHKSKKKPSIAFKEFPTAVNEIENIVLNFVKEMRRQSVVRNGKKWTMEEVAEMVGADNMSLDFSFTCIGYDRNDPFSYLKDNDVYVYAGNKEKGLMFPVEHMDHVEIQVRERDIDIVADGKTFFSVVKEERRRDNSLTLCMGKSFRFTVEPGGKASFKFSLAGTLDERITAVRFMLAIIKEKGFFLDNAKVDLDIVQSREKEKPLESFEARLKHLIRVKEVLDRMNVKVPLDVDAITDREDEYLNFLIKTQIYGERATFQNPPQSICTLEIANLHLIMLLTKHKDGSYYVDDFFQKEIDCYIDDPKKTAVSQFSILAKKDYLQANNLVTENIAESFMKHRNPYNHDRCNLSVLEILRAYDEDNKRTELLELAEKLCEWLLQEDPDNSLYKLNRMQCCVRRGELEEDMLLELTRMSQHPDNTAAVNAGIQILLGNARMAQLYIDRISDDKERQEFMDYPIYHLMKRS